MTQSILYGKLASSINCTYEAELKNRSNIKYSSLHFIINYLQLNNNIYKVDKYTDIKRASEVNEEEIKEERLILEVSTRLDKDNFSHLKEITKDSFVALYLQQEPFIKKNHVSKITRKLRNNGETYNILSYFIKVWGDSLKVELMELEEEEFLINSPTLSVCDSVYKITPQLSNQFFLNRKILNPNLVISK